MHHTVPTSHLITQHHLKDRTSQRKGEENNGQKISINKIPINRSIDNKEDSQDTVIRTRYVQVIRKLDSIVRVSRPIHQPKSTISVQLQHKTSTFLVDPPVNQHTSQLVHKSNSTPSY